MWSKAFSVLVIRAKRAHFKKTARGGSKTPQQRAVQMVSGHQVFPGYGCYSHKSWIENLNRRRARRHTEGEKRPRRDDYIKRECTCELASNSLTRTLESLVERLEDSFILRTSSPIGRTDNGETWLNPMPGSSAAALCRLIQRGDCCL